MIKNNNTTKTLSLYPSSLSQELVIMCNELKKKQYQLLKAGVRYSLKIHYTSDLIT